MIFSMRDVELSHLLHREHGGIVPDQACLPSCVRVCGCERVFEPIVWSSRLLSSLLSYVLCVLLSMCLVDVCLIDSQTINKVI